jgi:hypothetical protein
LDLVIRLGETEWEMAAVDDHGSCRALGVTKRTLKDEPVRSGLGGAWKEMEGVEKEPQEREGTELGGSVGWWYGYMGMGMAGDLDKVLLRIGY